MCVERAAELANRTFVQDGSTRLVLVGSGAPEVGRAVAESLALTRLANVGMLVDPSARIYSLVGAKSGVMRTFTWTRWENVVGFLAFLPHVLHGRLPFVNAGNPWLQGCTFVLSADGAVKYGLIEETPGYPRVDLVALARAVRAGSGAPTLVRVVPKAAPVSFQSSRRLTAVGAATAVVVAFAAVAVGVFMSRHPPQAPIRSDVV